MKPAFLPLLLLASCLALEGCSTRPPCDASSCEGCCDATGLCRVGTAADACGAKGATCAVCASGCMSGACLTVDAGAPDAGATCQPSTEAPTGRSDFGGAYDAVNDELVVFGGDPGVAVNCQSKPEFSEETWFFSPGCGTWRRSPVQGPSPRARHASAFDTQRRRLIVFGGRYRLGTSGDYLTYNDVHALSLGLDATPNHAWEELTTRGTRPPPLSSAAAVYDATGDRFIVFGGNTSNNGGVFAPNGRVFALALSDNTWSELVPTAGVAPARLFHAMALDAQRNRLVAFAGGDANAFLGPFFRDVVTFDLTTRVWAPLTLSGSAPLGRIRPMMVADPARDRLLVFGGHDDGQLGETNDLWAINLAANRWERLRAGDTLKTPGNGFCDFPADFTNADLMSPERREGSVFTPAGPHGVLMFGGRSDCGTVSDVWKLDPVMGQWTSLRPSFAGLSCERSGRTNCTKLCF
ncbi:MAG: hypothetical protein IAE78_13460 [Myxococcus sp.]|nr:hypothetical protein [Myxococcus sp.]